MIDSSLLDQVKTVFAPLVSKYTFKVNRDVKDKHTASFTAFLEDLASCSDHISCEYHDGEKFSFSLLRDGQDTGIRFKGIPNGHEFTSLLLAILNADHKGKNLPDATLTRRIKALKGKIKLQTYVSLTCTNCPDVIQALNVMALTNPNITNEMIDGELYQDDITRLNIQGVPSVYANGELLHVGRGDLGTLLQELEDKIGTTHDEDAQKIERNYDILILGGGPAGCAAAIYSARKGLKTAIVAERIGGQVNDTTGIENIVSIPKTTGTKLAGDLRNHLQNYPIDIFDNRKITEVHLLDKAKTVTVRGGEIFKAPAVIIATGASWRRLGLKDEDKYIGHGIHFCPHCDGPFYKGKNVAVIGGGNSGIEAAIDLAGICNHVTVFEFGEKMKADEVLQKKIHSLGNVDIFMNSQTTKVQGDGQKLTGITVKDLKTEKSRQFNFDGIFVQIGLYPNSDPFKKDLELTARHEIPVDAFDRTKVTGVYAAGDVSTVPFKQIMIAMGEGAKAALAAFEDRIRGVI